MRRALVIVSLLAGVLGACGGKEAPDQTVAIEMRDIAYSPTTIAVKAGDLVELRFHNRGKVNHDAFIGNADAQRKHEQTMRNDEGAHEHGASAVTVKPGKTGTLRHTFRKADDGVLIGCHEPGHYRAGMRIRVTVS